MAQFKEIDSIEELQCTVNFSSNNIKNFLNCADKSNSNV